jgi:glycosyltransferase involved in cell wall biosynthesis
MLSVIVPCYNEAENINIIVEKFIQAMPKATNAEIILVDNGSTDNSEQLIKIAITNNPECNLKLVTVEQNKGYGHGILAGLDAASGTTLAWTHADLQTEPSDVFRAYSLYRSINSSSTLVKGHRKNRKFSELVFSFGMQIIASILLKTWLTDINAQPKLFSHDFYIKHIKDNAPLDFSLDLYLLFQAKKYGKIKTINVDFKKRIHGEAKGGGSLKTRIKLITRTFCYIFTLATKVES